MSAFFLVEPKWTTIGYVFGRGGGVRRFGASLLKFEAGAEVALLCLIYSGSESAAHFSADRCEVLPLCSLVPFEKL